VIGFVKSVAKSNFVYNFRTGYSKLYFFNSSFHLCWKYDSMLTFSLKIIFVICRNKSRLWQSSWIWVL